MSTETGSKKPFSFATKAGAKPGQVAMTMVTDFGGLGAATGEPCERAARQIARLPKNWANFCEENGTCLSAAEVLALPVETRHKPPAGVPRPRDWMHGGI